MKRTLIPCLLGVLLAGPALAGGEAEPALRPGINVLTLPATTK